jgi:hypothetical protein
MSKIHFCVPLVEAHFASGKALRFIGICWMASADCHRSLGAIRNPWLAQSRWLIALLFMHTIYIAQLTVKMLFHSLAGSMGDGSHLIFAVHSRVSPTAATGKGYSSFVIKYCAV